MNPLNAILSQMMNLPQVQSNPMAKNAMDMYRKGDSQGLKTMAENLCRENGTTIEQMKNEVMQRFNLR